MDAYRLSSKLLSAAFAIDVASDCELSLPALLRTAAEHLKKEADSCVNVGYEVEHFTYGEPTEIVRYAKGTTGMGISRLDAEKIETIVQDILGCN